MAGLAVAVAVKGSTSAHDGGAIPRPRPCGGLGPPPKPAYPDPAATLAPVRPRPRWPGPAGDLAAGHQNHPWQPHRGHGQLFPGYPGPARTSATPPAPAADRSFRACWLLAEWPPRSRRARWVTGCPPCPRTLLPKNWCAWPRSAGSSIERDYRELKTGLGLGHFEGRSFLGWHRHVTLAVLAQAFFTMMRTGPKAPAPG